APLPAAARGRLGPTGVGRPAPRRPPPAAAAPTLVGTVATVVVGVALWAGFAFWAHAAWLGVAPMGR
ncbi:hypothetical protein ABTK78_19350, partial [Acinetobacter baumannii]